MAYYTTGNDVTYRYWTSATSGSTTTADYVWHNWNDTSGTSYTYSSNTTAGDDTWHYWVGDSAVIPYQVVKEVEPAKEYQEIVIGQEKTSEQQRADKVQQIINRQWRDYLIEEDRKQKELAELTAQSLLEDLVEEDYFKVYKETGRLVVHGRKHDYVLVKGKGVYRVL